MVRVLFVCLGNICRSPSAEAVFRALVKDQGLEDRITTDSAGTGAWHVGNPPDERAQLVGKARGVRMDDLRARQVQEQDYHDFDYILAMDESNYANLLRIRPNGCRGKLSRMLDFGGLQETEVPDPYYGELADYEIVFDLLNASTAGLLQLIRKTHDI